MGQYYTPALAQDEKVYVFNNRTALVTDEDKEEYKKNSYYNYHGSKIMAHSWVGNHFVNGIAKRIFNKPGRLAWVGDYTEEKDIKGSDAVPFPITSEKVLEVDEQTNEPNIKYVKYVRYNPNFNLEGMYFVNLTKKEYIDMSAYIKRSTSDDGWCVNPIPLMTSTGGDQGGGDYHEGLIDQHIVGTWQCDLVKLTKRKPGKDFKELDVIFNENITTDYKGLK